MLVEVDNSGRAKSAYLQYVNTFLSREQCNTNTGHVLYIAMNKNIPTPHSNVFCVFYWLQLLRYTAFHAGISFKLLTVSTTLSSNVLYLIPSTSTLGPLSNLGLPSPYPALLKSPTLSLYCGKFSCTALPIS